MVSENLKSRQTKKVAGRVLTGTLVNIGANGPDGLTQIVFKTI